MIIGLFAGLIILNAIGILYNPTILGIGIIVPFICQLNGVVIDIHYWVILAIYMWMRTWLNTFRFVDVIVMNYL